jgi:ABC-2 type transport system ATP-binding protein
VPPIIQAREIVRRYGKRTALDHFTLDVPAGCVFGLLGPNGSGKSTFLALLSAMEAPAEGTLSVFGQRPSPDLRARIGVVFQEGAADPLMSPRELLALSGRLFGVDRATIRERSLQLLATFGLDDRANDPIAALSGGMRRRLEIARALLHDPDLLLLDEPTTGVDPDERRIFWDLLLQRERGARTVLLATNDLAEADHVCEQVAFVRLGRVIASGTPAALKQGLRSETVRVQWTGLTDENARRVAAMPGAGQAARDGDLLSVSVDDASAFVPALFALADGAIRSVRIDPASLEDAYFQHVGQRFDARTEATV